MINENIVLFFFPLKQNNNSSTTQRFIFTIIKTIRQINFFSCFAFVNSCHTPSHTYDHQMRKRIYGRWWGGRGGTDLSKLGMVLQKRRNNNNYVFLPVCLSVCLFRFVSFISLVLGIEIIILCGLVSFSPISLMSLPPYGFYLLYYSVHTHTHREYFPTCGYECVCVCV